MKWSHLTIEDIIARLEQSYKDADDIANEISLGNSERAVGAVYAYREAPEEQRGDW